MRRFVHYAARYGLALLLAARALGAAEAAESRIEFLYGDREIFPSVLLALSEDCRYLPRDQSRRGDHTGLIAVRVTAPVPNARVRVTLAETDLFAESTVSDILPTAGETVRLAPSIRWHPERLARIRQPLANFVIRVIVDIEGRRTELAVPTVVHSINEWLRMYRPQSGRDGTVDTRILAAAYVDENNPAIDRVITRTALSLGLADLFLGYTGGGKVPGTVDRKELVAVYGALEVLGFKPAARRPMGVAADPKKLTVSVPQTEYVRLVDDALAAKQASVLEAAAVLASAYIKLGLAVVLVLEPGAKAMNERVMLGVYQQRPVEGKLAGITSLLFLDPALLGVGTFAAAEAEGKRWLDSRRRKLEPLAGASAVTAEDGTLWLDILRARRDGVLPIPELVP